MPSSGPMVTVVFLQHEAPLGHHTRIPGQLHLARPMRCQQNLMSCSQQLKRFLAAMSLNVNAIKPNYIIYRLKREERVCKECDSGEVEDVVHWMIRCPVWIGHREALLKQCHDHSSFSDEDTTARILCLACHNHKTASVIHTMWKARFGT